VPITYHPYVPRFVKAGWSFLDFTQWLYPRFKIIPGPVSEMATYWARWEKSATFVHQLAQIEPDRYVPHLYHSGPLYPGRTHEFTYTVSFRTRTSEADPWEEAFVTTISDTELTKGEILQWAEERVATMPDRYDALFGDFELHSAEWKQRAD